jgi:DNA-directed RNA polymerase subunit F
MFDHPMLNSILLSVIGTFLAFLAARHWHLRNLAVSDAKSIREANEKLLSRVTELEREHALVKAAVVPITTAFQALLIKELTHFHTPIMDALMVKIGPPNTLTEDEAKQLEILLKERADDIGDVIPVSEKEAAIILPYVMRKAKVEQEQINQESILAVVAIPKANGNATNNESGSSESGSEGSSGSGISSGGD